MDTEYIDPNYVDPLYVIFHIEYASLNLYPSEVMKTFQPLLLNVLYYLDGKPNTPRRDGAYSHLVKLLDPKLHYIGGNHFVLRNPSYANTYQMFGGSMNVPAQASSKQPTLAKSLPHYRFIGGMNPDVYSLYERLEDDAPFYYGGRLTAEQIDEKTFESYHHALVQAGIGARMEPELSGAKMTEYRLKDILFYIAHVPPPYDEVIINERCDDLLDSVVILSENYKVDPRLVICAKYLVGYASFEMTAQILGLPPNEEWVTDDILRIRLGELIMGKYDPSATGHDINERRTGYLVGELSNIYPEHEIDVHHIHDGIDSYDFSPIDVFIFNDGPDVYVVDREMVTGDGINPISGDPLPNNYINTEMDFIKYALEHELLPPQPLSEYLTQNDVFNTSIYEALNDPEIMSELQA